MLPDVAITGATFVIALVLTPWAIRVATARQILDRPGARSLHSRPVPRFGGISIVVTFNLAILALVAMRAIDTPLAFVLIGGGLPVAIVGTLDDRGSLPVNVRIIVHFAAAIYAVHTLGGAAPLRLGGGWVLNDGVLGNALCVVSITWTLNLFNFMDGIDGIATSEAAFITLGGAIIALVNGVFPTIVPAIFALCGASLGFLAWNWQPAKIFMGDVGSGYLGYCIAVLALSMAHQRAEIVPTWLILGGVFFVDATVTLLRRMARGEKVYEAHRTHAYQWLARRWKSHQRVTLLAIALNILWLFPCALLVSREPDHAIVISLCALMPVVVAAFAAGSGRRETAKHGGTARGNTSSTDDQRDEWRKKYGPS